MGSLVCLPNNFIADWGIAELLLNQQRLRLKPIVDKGITIEGNLEFNVQKPGRKEVTDSFAVRIEVPRAYPSELPLVYPLDLRIPQSFHRLDCGAFCLGSPTRQRLSLARSRSLLRFANQFVIPYLYSYALVEQGEDFPYGELPHGRSGLIEDFKNLFKVNSKEAAKELVYLTSRPKRKANRSTCPCGSDLRLSRCQPHHRLVLEYRKAIGRHWFRWQLESLEGGTRKRIKRG